MFSNVEGKFDVTPANRPYIAADFDDAEEQFATSIRYLPIFSSWVQDYLENVGRLFIQFRKWFQP
jgi:hypothetical protein